MSADGYTERKKRLQKLKADGEIDIDSERLPEEMEDDEEDDEIDLGHKLLDLQKRSEHPNFEHVGYIKWVHDNTDTTGRVKIDVQYPDGDSEFTDSFKWPKDFNMDSRLRRAVECDALPFSSGSFTNDTLQNEAIPIDPDRKRIEIPQSRTTSLKERVMENPRVKATKNMAEAEGYISTSITLMIQFFYFLIIASIAIVFFAGAIGVVL